MPSTRPRIGLVLGAGGIAGRAFHDGVLDALRQTTGWQPETADHIVGTSAGSIVGAWLRAGGPRRSVTAPANDAAKGGLPVPLTVLLATARRPLRARVGVLATSVVPAGKRPHYTTEELRSRYGASWPAAALWLVAVRRRDGRRVVFGRAGEPGTDVASAVAASCAVPGYYQPMRIAGEEYLDGGVHSPTNADLLADEDLDLVIVSSAMSAARIGVSREAPMRWMWHRYVASETRPLRRRGVPVWTVEPDESVLHHLSLGVADPGNTEEIRTTAREMTLRKLEHSDAAAAVDLLGARTSTR